MLKRTLLIAALALSSLFAADDNALLLQRVAALPSVKAHGYVPLKVEPQGQLFVAYGYFDVAGRSPADPHRKVYADMYLSPDLETAVYGDGYNTHTGAHYTHTDMKAIAATEALTVGKGPLQVYLVADPHCPACKSFERQMAQYGDRATIHVVLVSLPMHPGAPDAIRCVLSHPKEERAKALTAIAEGKAVCEGKTPNPRLYALQMEAMEDSAQMLRTRATPSLYLEDGSPLQIPEFIAMMQKAKKPEKTAAK